MAKPLQWRLFQDVVVPAVLGNTLWAFLFLLAATDWHQTTPPRLLVLALLSVFLLRDWTGGDDDPAVLANAAGRRLWLRYLLPTTLFYLAIAAAGIQVGTTARHAYLPLAGLFGVTSIGQFTGVWMRVPATNEDSVSRGLRLSHGVANLIAAAVIIVAGYEQSLSFSGAFNPGQNSTEPTPHWIAFGATVIATAPWLLRRPLKKYFEARRHPAQEP